MTPPIRPEPDDTINLSDADLWEKLVREGVPKEQATAKVTQRKETQPFAGPGRGSGRSWEPESPGMVTGSINAFTQGGTFNFGDELAGMMGMDTRALRESDRAFRSEHPVADFAARSAGTIATTLAVPQLRRLGATTGGGVIGAAGAAGDADDGSLGDRAMAALMGGTVGAASGAVLEHAVSPLARMGYDMARAGGKKLASAFTTDAGAAAAGKAASPNVATGGGFAPPNAARGKAGVVDPVRSVARDLMPRSPKERAQSLVLEKLRDDDLTPQAIRDLALSSSKPRALADLAGENTLGLQRGARSIPSRAKNQIAEALEERQAGQQARLVGDATELTGSARSNTTQRIAQLAEEREAASAKAFAPLRELPPQDATPLLEFLQTPAGQQAVKQAERIARNERRAFLPIFQEDGTARPLSFDDVQNIKLAFDDLLGSNPATPLESGGLGKNNSRVIRGLKNAYLESADAMFPGYKEARDVFAGPSALMNALDEGSRFLKMPQEEAAQAMAQLSASEREAFVEGAVNAVADKIESGMKTFDRSRVILPTQMQQRLKLLFPDEQSFGQFLSRAEEEAAMRNSYTTTLGGSQTADKMAEQLDLDASGISRALQTAKGGMRGAMDMLTNSAMANRMTGVTRETANELSPLFTAGMTWSGKAGEANPLDDALADLIQAQSREARRATTRSAASRPFTAGTASIFTPPGNRR